MNSGVTKGVFWVFKHHPLSVVESDTFRPCQLVTTVITKVGIGNHTPSLNPDYNINEGSEWMYITFLCPCE